MMKMSPTTKHGSKNVSFGTVKIGYLNAFTDNYIWFLHDGVGIIIVDPGESKAVIDYIVTNKLDLRAIILTHDHYDHVGGVADLLAYADVPVYGTCTLATTLVADGEKLLLPLNLVAKVIFTPGHTNNSICYLIDGIGEQKHLFCGDTLFAAGCGRVFTGDYVAMYNSLKHISSLDLATSIYPAHEYTLKNLQFAQFIEPNNLAVAKRSEHETQQIQHYGITLPTQLELELKTNPFLRCEEEALVHTLGQEVNPGLECFIKLRELRNNF